MKDQGVPYTPSWNGKDPLPGQVAIRLKPGQALIRNGVTIHTGHCVPERERNTLSIVGRNGAVLLTKNPRSPMRGSHGCWILLFRDALPHDWMKTAWDRWAARHKLGDTLEDRYAGLIFSRLNRGKSSDGRRNWNAKPLLQEKSGNATRS